MRRTSRRVFLWFVSSSMLAIATDASAGLFSHCMRRIRRRRRCPTPTPKDAYDRLSCAGKVCLQSLIGEVEDLDGSCLYRQYEAYQCEPSGGYTTILHERDCADVTPLPQGTCATSGTCSNCEGGFVVVPPIQFKAKAQPLGRRHSAGKGLAKNGLPDYGVKYKPRNGQRIIDEQIVLMPGTRRSANTRRRVKLVWLRPTKGEPYGIGFEVADGVPTIPEKDVKHQPLKPGQQRPVSYSVTIRLGTIQRHYSVYMKR